MSDGVKILVFILLVGLFTSCFSNLPVSTQPADNNKTFTVDFLFEHDGCKVYRFYDRGSYVYFTNCTGDATAIKNDSTRRQIPNSVRVTYEKYGGAANGKTEKKDSHED